MSKVTIRSSACKGCLLCVAVCRPGILAQSTKLNASGVAAVKVRAGAVCAGCGQCVLICPENCILLEKKK
jgi:2-oxoglutarate ferredoxin oxidoreductase subunit delta